MTYQSNPFDLVPLSYQGFRRTWQQYLALFALGVGGALLGLIVGAIAWQAGPLAGIGLGLLVFALILAYLAPAFYLVTMAAARQKMITMREAMTYDLSLVVQLFWAHLLVGVLTILGFIALIVPGLLCLAWFAAVPYVVINERLYGLAALRRSKQLAGGRLRDVWGTIALPSAANVLVVIPVLGFIAALILSVILIPVTAIRYLQLQQAEADGTKATQPVSAWNYLVIALGIIGVVGMSANDTRTNSQPTTLNQAVIASRPHN